MRWPKRGRSSRRGFFVVGGLILFVLVLTGARLAWREYQFNAAVAGALESIRRDPSLTDRWIADWIAQAEQYVAGGREAVIRRLLREGGVSDAPNRALLTALTGCDFGDRADEWRNALARRSSDVGRSDLGHVLAPRWSAPVGLTRPTSSILPIDGQIYIASSGASFDAPDAADGIVRVDRGGRSELVTVDGHSAAGDVAYLAWGGGRLFGATPAGVLACDPSGKPLWVARTPAPPACSPVYCELPHERKSALFVLLSSGVVQALQPSNGALQWRITLDARISKPASANATLALGDVLGNRRPDLVASFAGGSFILDVVDGRLIEARSAAADAATACVLARDGRAARWFQAAGSAAPRPPSRGRLSELSLEDFGARVVGLAPQLRTISAPRGEELFVAVSASVNGLVSGSLLAFSPDTQVWRASLAGTALAPPAIADVDGDRESDILVSVNAVEAGRLLIWSRHGRLLAQMSFAVPLAAGPVVADVDGDGCLDVLVADADGLLHCLATRSRGPVEWGTPSGDPWNTLSAANAYAFGQTPFGYQAAWRPAD
ncbi:MAG: hypothetical protein CHACPFDD_01867 [Phycisphaerae bacterium]|nr:hypothetical protein [Phycisphaerae bacterium]